MNFKDKAQATELANRLQYVEMPAKLKQDILAFLRCKQRVKCKDCLGSGERCHSGSAHPLNWYTCEACDGTGAVTV